MKHQTCNILLWQDPNTSMALREYHHIVVGNVTTKDKKLMNKFFLHPSEVTSQGKKGSLKSLSGQQRVLIWLPACLSTMFFMLQRSVRGTRILLIGGAHSQTRPLSPTQTSRHTHRSRRCPVKFTPLRSETTDSYTPHTLCCLGSAWFL